ncbi:serine protease inhibitor Kazal-type 2 [Monodelphis domestica]|uniref:serine protease inhibitor Kazal-type 2 n=1 Tax=Monodelphis domestica TaxID=13616 RepID=UPI0004431203|nr:serine protease inhibitor Kazal-type 2 [Monodelphis domestica]
MKRLLLVFPLFVMLLTKNFTVASSHEPFYDDNGEIIMPDCKMYGNPGCPRDLNPVCGTDSLTYPNECSLCEKSREQGKDIQIKWKGFC